VVAEFKYIGKCIGGILDGELIKSNKSSIWVEETIVVYDQDIPYSIGCSGNYWWDEKKQAYIW